MLTKEQYLEARDRARGYFEKAGIALTDQERETIEVADFGLGRLAEFGLEIVVYINTSRCCAKELILFPRQTCPEHRHPNIGADLGKEETFRCRWGQVYLYVPGPAAANPKAHLPSDSLPHFTVWREVVLNPGEQYTLAPDTLHWFQAGPEGAVVSEFSTTSRDEADIFTDPRIQRIPKVAD